jgi:hypothetical protein
MNRFVIISLLNNQKINYLHYTYTKTHSDVLSIFIPLQGGRRR